MANDIYISVLLEPKYTETRSRCFPQIYSSQRIFCYLEIQRFSLQYLDIAPVEKVYTFCIAGCRTSSSLRPNSSQCTSFRQLRCHFLPLNLSSYTTHLHCQLSLYCTLLSLGAIHSCKSPAVQPSARNGSLIASRIGFITASPQAQRGTPWLLVAAVSNFTAAYSSGSG